MWKYLALGKIMCGKSDCGYFLLYKKFWSINYESNK